MSRESWKSRYGFVLAASGSAVGLANLWHFPYVVGLYGGGAFLLFYLIFLVGLSLPIFIAEVALGRTTKRGPVGSLVLLSGEKRWSYAGKALIAIGFVVSSLYGVLASWVAGYLYEALRGGLSSFTTVEVATESFSSWLASPWKVAPFHLLFMLFPLGILLAGVRSGIERANKVMMPLLLLLLLALAIRGVMLPDAGRAIRFLFRPDFSQIGMKAVLAALSQAFFTLSLGQGTMITFGSYLKGGENLISLSLPVLLFDLVTAFLSTVVIVTVLFAGGFSLNGGPGVLFETVPTVFASLPMGQLFAIAFFFLVFIAALSSQIAALEPLINYFTLGRKWSRQRAVFVATGGAFLLGVPSALSFSLFKSASPFRWINTLAIDVAVPLGALTVVLFIGWVWGWHTMLETLHVGMKRRISPLFGLLIKYLAPLLIVIVFLNGLGLFF